MSAPSADYSKPDFAFAVDSNMDWIRDNEIVTIISLGIAGGFVVGWNSLPDGGTPAKPATITMTGPGGRKIRATLSYTGDNVTGVVAHYDKNLGSGFELLALGTGTNTFDGSGNWTGTTWA